MPYYFDQWGFLTDTILPNRSTEVVPPVDVPDGWKPNWTGHAWRVIPYFAPLVFKRKAITRRQLKIALLRLGLLDNVESWIAANSDRELKIGFLDADVFERDSPLIEALRDQFNRTDAQIDSLWDTAETL